MTGTDVAGRLHLSFSRVMVERIAPGVMEEAEACCPFADPRDRKNWIAGFVGWEVERSLDRAGLIPEEAE